MQVQNEDITVAWGQQPHHLDQQFGRWRLAVFQDVQESIDMSKLYFLYDPVSDEESGTTGSRKGSPGLIIFDTNIRCFAGEIPIQAPGSLKFLFSLKCPSPQGGSAFVLVTAECNYQNVMLHIFRLDMTADGRGVANLRPLLTQPVVIGGDFICCMRDDAPEIVVVANPGMQVWRVDAMSETPRQPIAYFEVQGPALDHFYDGFLSNGNLIFLSASPDGHFDGSRVHLVSLSNQGQITTSNCHPDPVRGMPSARKQAGVDSVTNALLLAGGEVERGYGNVERLVDYWVLDTRTFHWSQIQSQMPCPLIEPRVTACNSGNVYVWGDFDQPLPGMPQVGTHLRIIRVTGMDKASHPPQYSATSVPPPPMYSSDNKTPYPNVNPGGGGGYGGYPGGQGGQGNVPPPYPSYNPTQQNPGGYSQPSYNQNQQYGQQPQYNAGQPAYEAPQGQKAFYPPDKKKDCSIQ